MMSTSKPGAYHAKKDDSGTSRKGGKRREGNDRSSGESSSSDRNKNRNPKLGAENEKLPDIISSPGAHATSGRSEERIARKARHDNSSAGSEQTPAIIGSPGAHATSGQARERMARKARHAESGASSSLKTGEAVESSSGLSSDPSRVEAKLREVGLAANEMMVESGNPQQSKDVPSAYEVEAELIEGEHEGKENKQKTIEGQHISADAPQGFGNDTRQRRLPWSWIVCIVLLAIAGAVVAVFLTRGGSESLPPPMGENEIEETPSPTTTFQPSATPSVTPTSRPTAVPTELLVFEPPSEEECEAIMNGDPIPDQAALGIIQFEILLNVQFTIDNPNVTSWNDTLQEQIQRRVVADLARCPTDNRNLQEGEQREFVIVSGKVSEVRPVPETECWDPSPSTGLCVPMRVVMSVAVKGEAGYTALTRLVREGFQDLDEKLDLGPNIAELSFESIGEEATPPPVQTPSPVLEPSPGETLV